MRRLSQRQKTRWYFLRYDALLQEGFTPEESDIMANFRISLPAMRRIRRRRKRALQRVMDMGLTRREAILELRRRVEEEDVQLNEWDKVRRALYPK